MSKPKVLVQLDCDAQSSVFDSVVAIDAGVDHLLRHANVQADAVRDLVYGAMFTRGPKDLCNSAIFVGGSDVAAGEKILREVTDSFIGPLRTSVMLDAGGANTTAAAAVLVAAKHLDLAQNTALVLGATGPVGQRVARLLARQGATVRVGSRRAARAQTVCQMVGGHVPGASLTAVETSSPQQLAQALAGVGLVVAAGAPGAQLLSADLRKSSADLRLAIDLNAVPPLGLEGVAATDCGELHGGIPCYGAIGVGSTKMKIHKAAIRRLFEVNDAVLDAEEIYELGRTID